jgi:signal transduction histidine kinase
VTILPRALVAQGVAALATAGVVAWLSVRLHGAPAAVGFDDDGGWTDVVVGLVLVGTGSVVLRGERRGRALGVVMVVNGWLWLATALASLWVVEHLTYSPGLPGAPLALDLVLRWGGVILFGLPLVLLLFPDGRLPRRRPWRPVAIASLVLTGVLPALVIVVPSSVADAGTPVSPQLAALQLDLLSLPMPGASWPVLRGVGIVALLLGMLAAFAVVVARYRGARGTRRLQMRWLLWAGIVDVVAIASALGAPELVEMVALTAAIIATAGAVMIAVARYRLYEIDRLLPTTVVAVVLGLLVVGVDALVLLVAGAALGGRDAALLAVAVVAVLYTPLRNRLWRAARRVALGGRDDPYGAMSTLAGHLESAAAPGEQLAAVARSVAEAFRLPYVRVEIDRADGARAVVEHGTPGDPPVTLPVRYRDETIGRVVIGGGARLSEADQRLLGDLLRQAAAAARAGALGASLQRTREALVTAREEERRRLRRDLHDSLGPGLAAVTLRIETARALAERDPARADAALVTATEDVSALLADVRRLVHDLRPPTLDELGLAGAVHRLAERLEGGVGVAVVADDLGPLPAAVEVAAFRIVSESLTNVVRHAGAARATVTLARTPTALEVAVADDGRGIDPEVGAGVGTLSVRERAAELGGTAAVSCPDGGGTVVTATLPLEAS